MSEVFDRNHRHWLDVSLAEYNEQFTPRQYHQESAPANYNPGDLVEIAEDGSAYPHGAGGTSHVPNAVTPWGESPHWVHWAE